MSVFPSVRHVNRKNIDFFYESVIDDFSLSCLKSVFSSCPIIALNSFKLGQKSDRLIIIQTGRQLLLRRNMPIGGTDGQTETDRDMTTTEYLAI